MSSIPFPTGQPLLCACSVGLSVPHRSLGKYFWVMHWIMIPFCKWIDEDNVGNASLLSAGRRETRVKWQQKEWFRPLEQTEMWITSKILECSFVYFDALPLLRVSSINLYGPFRDTLQGIWWGGSNSKTDQITFNFLQKSLSYKYTSIRPAVECGEEYCY